MHLTSSARPVLICKQCSPAAARLITYPRFPPPNPIHRPPRLSPRPCINLPPAPPSSAPSSPAPATYLLSISIPLPFPPIPLHPASWLLPPPLSCPSPYPATLSPPSICLVLRLTPSSVHLSTCSSLMLVHLTGLGRSRLAQDLFSLVSSLLKIMK